MKKTIATFVLCALSFMVLSVSLSAAVEERIELSPSAPYDRFIIFQNLTIFWLAVIGLIVIIRLKTKEIKRVQGLGLKEKEERIPSLD